MKKIIYLLAFLFVSASAIGQITILPPDTVVFPAYQIPTLDQVLHAGEESHMAMGVGGITILPQMGNQRIDITNEAQILMGSGSETKIALIGADGTISFGNGTTAVELWWKGDAPQVANFIHKNTNDTVAYLSDMPINLSQLTATVPTYENDSVAGANGLTQGKIYKSLIGGDAFLKVKK